MNNSNNSNTDIFKINGTENADECGLFDAFYMDRGKKSKKNIKSFFVDELGNFNLHIFAPNIKDEVIYKFLYEPFHIYRNEISDGVITTSLRGIVDMDFIHFPFCSLVDLRRVIPKGQQVKAFLIDTATDKIKGIRLVELSDETISQLLKDWTTIKYSGFSDLELLAILQKKAHNYSPDTFFKASTYVGRDTSSMVPRTLFIAP